MRITAVSAIFSGLMVLSPRGADAQAVAPPSFGAPELGFYCSMVWPTAGWVLISTNPGDLNANPCEGAANGASITRTGMYSPTGTNIAKVLCSPNYYWIYQGQGASPLGAAFHDASTTKTEGNCLFNVTIGSALRKPLFGPTVPPPQLAALPFPNSNAYSLQASTFADHLSALLEQGAPAPVGFQIAIRDPLGALVFSQSYGSASGGAPGISEDTDDDKPSIRPCEHEQDGYGDGADGRNRRLEREEGRLARNYAGQLDCPLPAEDVERAVFRPPRDVPEPVEV